MMGLCHPTRGAEGKHGYFGGKLLGHIDERIPTILMPLAAQQLITGSEGNFLYASWTSHHTVILSPGLSVGEAPCSESFVRKCTHVSITYSPSGSCHAPLCSTLTPQR